MTGCSCGRATLCLLRLFPLLSCSIDCSRRNYWQAAYSRPKHLSRLHSSTFQRVDRGTTEPFVKRVEHSSQPTQPPLIRTAPEVTRDWFRAPLLSASQ